MRDYLQETLDIAKLGIKNEYPESELNLLVQELCKANGIPEQIIDRSEFIKILKLTRAAHMREETYPSPEREKKLASQQAFKLILFFSNYQNSLDYISKVAKKDPGNELLIHDACLIEFPMQANWNIALWRQILVKHQPSGHEDAIMRIFEVADQVELYLQNTPAKIFAEHIADKLRRDDEAKYGLEYEEQKRIAQSASDNLIENFLAKQAKKMQSDIAKRFDYYLKETLGINTTKLTLGQLDMLRARKNNPTIKDQEKLKTITDEINKLYHQQAKKKFLAQHMILNIHKESYIAKKMKESEPERLKKAMQIADEPLSVDTPLFVLSLVAEKVIFKRKNENPQAARLFNRFKKSEKDFNLYLQLNPKDNDEHIPNAYIDGASIAPAYANFYLKKMYSNNPLAALLGERTSCCQSIGREGEKPTIFGIENEMAGFYVLCAKDLPEEDGANIMSQFLAWRDKDGYMILDSIETNTNSRISKMQMNMDFAIEFAEILKTKHDIPGVFVGGSGQTPKKLLIMAPMYVKRPIDYSGYRDSYMQYYLSDMDLPIRELYLSQNPDSLLTRKAEDKELLPINIIIKWLDLCLINNNLKALDVISHHLEKYPDKKAAIDYYIADHLSLARFLTEFPDDKPMREWELKAFRQGLLRYQQNGANLNLHFIKESPPALIFCIMNNEYDLVNMIIKHHHAPLNATHFSNIMPLIFAVKHASLKMVKLLCDAGADPNLSDATTNETPLAAAIRCKKWDIVEYLLPLSSNLDVKNENGEYIFYSLLHAGKTELIEQMLIRGVELSRYPLSLFYAARSGNAELIDLLLARHSFDLSIEDLSGESIVDVCLTSDRFAILKVIQKYTPDLDLDSKLKPKVRSMITSTYNPFSKEKCDFFIEHLSTLSQEDKKELLLVALKNADIESAARLVEADVTIDIDGYLMQRLFKDDIMQSPDIRAVDFLLQKGVDINSRDETGKTILHYAALQFWMDGIDHLLKAGADPDIEDNNHYTPLTIVKSHEEYSEDYDNLIKNLVFASHKPILKCPKKFSLFYSEEEDEHYVHITSAVNNKR